MIRMLLMVFAFISFVFCSAKAQAGEPAAYDEKAVASFYRGKTVTILVGHSAGGGFDTYARVISRHLGKYIPGNPGVMVNNMPGAGTIISANYTFNQAPKDGTLINSFDGGIVPSQLYGSSAVQFDFAAVMWLAHFSPLFDAALEDELLHRIEHALFLGAALLFWWPVVGADPSPHRLGHPARILYLALGMPLSSLLGLVIFSASTVLYPHYATLERSWGMSPLEDQAWAGGIMWAGGDLAFVVAIVAAVAVWLRHEEREAQRVDARLARQRPGPERTEVAARIE